MARSPFYWLDQLVRLNIVGSRVLPVIESKIKFVLPQVQLTFLWLDQHRRIINAYDSQVFKHARPHAQLQKLFSICDDANWMSFCSQLQSKQFKHTPVQHATGTDHCAAFLINYLPDPSYRESMVVGVLRNEQLAGILLLHRPEASPPFSSLEKQRAIELGNRLNLLLQPNAIHQESEIDSGEEGALFINRKLHPTYICDAAYKLLFLLNYSIVDKTTLAKLQEHHDICNYTINRHLHDVVPAVFESQKPSVKYLVSGWGKFRIQCN